MTESTKTMWHLGDDENGLKIINFEFIFWRVYHSWIRWQEDCESCISEYDLTAHEIALLHIVRMKERPKTVYEIGRLLNRDDTPNMQYGLKKMVGLGLIKKVDVSSGTKKGIAYQITKKGLQDTDAYTKARKDILLKIIKEYASNELDFEGVTKMLFTMRGVYEEASRLTASYEGGSNNS